MILPLLYLPPAASLAPFPEAINSLYRLSWSGHSPSCLMTIPSWPAPSLRYCHCKLSAHPVFTILSPCSLHKGLLDYENADAVKALNQAIMLHEHGIHMDHIPSGHMCPSVPNRYEYIRTIQAVALKWLNPADPVTCIDMYNLQRAQLPDFIEELASRPFICCWQQSICPTGISSARISISAY